MIRGFLEMYVDLKKNKKTFSAPTSLGQLDNKNTRFQIIAMCWMSKCMRCAIALKLLNAHNVSVFSPRVCVCALKE